jgi:hypothetical protein
VFATGEKERSDKAALHGDFFRLRGKARKHGLQLMTSFAYEGPRRRRGHVHAIQPHSGAPRLAFKRENTPRLGDAWVYKEEKKQTEQDKAIEQTKVLPWRQTGEWFERNLIFRQGIFWGG